MFENKYKKLIKKYKRKLRALSKNKKYFPSFSDSLEYFITYIKFLRDYVILTTDFDELSKNINVATLCMAINEYELYEKCFDKYYKKVNNSIERRNMLQSSEVTAAKYAEEKTQHLNNFWAVVVANLDNWKDLYDCTI